MANTKISAETDRTTLDGTEYYPITTGGANYRTSTITTRHVTTTAVSATASIDAAAILGQDIVTWTPSAGTGGVGVYKHGRQRKFILNTVNGAVQSPDHPTCGYDYFVMQGANNCDLAFVHQSKFSKSDGGTLGSISFYKPSIDGTFTNVTNMKFLDCEMDLTGITLGGKAYAVYSPDTDKYILHNGGMIKNVTLIVGSTYTLTDADGGNFFLGFAGAPIAVTVPSTVLAGVSATFIQGDANQISFAGSGGNSVLNASSHTKTRTALSAARVHVITNGSGGATILEGDTAA